MNNKNFESKVIPPATLYKKYSDKKNNDFKINYKVFDEIVKNLNLEYDNNEKLEKELSYKFEHKFNTTTDVQNQYIQMFLIKRLNLADLKLLIYIILEYLNAYRIIYYSIMVSNSFYKLGNSYDISKDIRDIYENFLIINLPRFNGYKSVVDKNILLTELFKIDYPILAIGLSMFIQYNNVLGIEFNTEMHNYMANNSSNNTQVVKESENITNACNNKNNSNQSVDNMNIIKNVCPIFKK